MEYLTPDERAKITRVSAEKVDHFIDKAGITDQIARLTFTSSIQQRIIIERDAKIAEQRAKIAEYADVISKQAETILCRGKQMVVDESTRKKLETDLRTAVETVNERQKTIVSLRSMVKSERGSENTCGSHNTTCDKDYEIYRASQALVGAVGSKPDIFALAVAAHDKILDLSREVVYLRETMSQMEAILVRQPASGDSAKGADTADTGTFQVP